MAQNVLDITADQKDATQRHDLYGVVYMVSGTLKGRGSIPDVDYYWATRTVTLSGEAGGSDVTFDAMLAPPIEIRRAQGFEPGREGMQPPILVPVRNLPFRHSESLVTAVVDDDYAWEQSTASVRVAYLKPGQSADYLEWPNWTYLLKDGFLGAPRDVSEDGLTLVAYHRDAKYNQLVQWPAMPSETDAIGTLQRKDAGQMAPILSGRPDGWVKPRSLNLGVQGFTTSEYSAGATEVEFRTISVGQDRLVSGNVPSLLHNPQGGDSAGLMIHYRKPVYTLVTGAAVYDESTQTYTVTLSSGLAASVPRGAFVQQMGPGRTLDNKTVWSTYPYYYAWCLAGHRAYHDSTQALQLGWLFPDGTIRPAKSSVWASYGLMFAAVSAFGDGRGFEDYVRQNYDVIHGYAGTMADPIPPVYFDPFGGTVGQQPEFSTTSKERMSSKLNYPTGGTGTGNALARDGSTDTGASLGVGSIITLTFNSAPSPFSDDDTTDSVLHVVTQGNIDFTDSAGSVTFGQANGTGGVNREFRFTQASARDYNETVRCVGAGGSGGTVVEVWWEHDLSADISLTRSQDVALVSGAVGEVMEYAELVVKLPAGGAGWWFGTMISGNADFPYRPNAPWQHGITEEIPDWSDAVIAAIPTAVMGGLLRQLLGKHEANVRYNNMASYNAAHARFVAEDIRLNFYLTERPSSWFALEQEVARQARARIFYGPSGHEMHFIEDAATLSGEAVQQEFRLPGVPGANATFSAGPLIERTPVSEVVNTYEATWNPDYVDNRQGQAIARGTNSGSVAKFGERRPPDGTQDYWMHSRWPMSESDELYYRYTAASGVSGIVQFRADRSAYAQTRFAFDTSWIAHGLDRGSIVRVCFRVADGIYRSSICEVEDIRGAPIRGERFSLTCRSIGRPYKSLGSVRRWVDLFIDDVDGWFTRVVNDVDTWDDYWSM